MSELRRNPLTHEWVVIASTRGARPREYAPPSPRPRRPRRRARCPFCPGNEHMTPPTILELPGPAGAAWTVRVVENAFPALTTPATRGRVASSALLRAVPSQGVHEVVIECPEHNRETADREPAEVRLALEACRARYASLAAAPGVAYVSVFKNRGRTAGASLEYPHSQIVALPIVPPAVRRRSEIAAAHRVRTGRCLMCDVVAGEAKDGRRVVRDSGGFVTLVPYAPEFPGEMWLVPRAHVPSFAAASEGDLGALAGALVDAAVRLRDRLGDPDFNCAVHSPASDEQDAAHHHWYVQMSARTTTLAGAELATGLRVNPEAPEDTAVRLRGC